jgi:hypothetical protein
MRKNVLVVNTTSYSNPDEELKNGNCTIETWYAGNGQFGLTASRYMEEFEDPIEVKVFVSTMFPGTFEEWNRHIVSCIEDAVVKNYPVEKNVFDNS